MLSRASSLIGPGSVTAHDYVVFVGTCLGLAAMLVVLGVMRIRRVIIRQAARPATGRKSDARRNMPRRLVGPSLDRHPLLWRERYRRRPSRWTLLIWAIYALLAVGFSVHAVGATWNNRGAVNLASTVIGVQVVVGLLLVSGAAATPLAEDRAHGTLGILLATPLSTGSILSAKWWATYRTVPRIAALPFGTLAAVCLIVSPHRLSGALVLLGLILSYGAAFTSLGLAAATWTARLSRAITWTVAGYVFMVIGWPLVAMLVWGNDNMSMALGDPFLGPAIFSQFIELEAVLADREHYYDQAFRGALWWIAIYFYSCTFPCKVTWFQLQ